VTTPATRWVPKRRHAGADHDLMLGLMAVLAGTCAVAWWWTTEVRVDLSLLDQIWSVVGYRDIKVPHVGYDRPSGASCESGGQPTFGSDLAPLKQQIGEAMGQRLECEHVNPDNGDLLQQTTTGLAAYRNPAT
jgi:hypothetical protein